jgi:hypothetical protein
LVIAVSDPRPDVIKTVQITAPHMCAAVTAKNGKIVQAAPILRTMIGWDGRMLANYCKKRGWSWQVVP